MATSTNTEPGRISDRCLRDTNFGAAAPGTHRIAKLERGLIGCTRRQSSSGQCPGTIHAFRGINAGGVRRGIRMITRRCRTGQRTRVSAGLGDGDGRVIGGVPQMKYARYRIGCGDSQAQITVYPAIGA